MSVFEYYDNKLPEYYPTMYLDGYSPEQILAAMWKKNRPARPAAQEPPFDIHITSEVKIK